MKPFESYKTSCITFEGFVGWSANQTELSIAYNSDSEILTAFQKVETVVRTQRHCLHADKFPMFWDGRTWQEFCGDFDLCWSE